MLQTEIKGQACVAATADPATRVPGSRLSVPRADRQGAVGDALPRERGLTFNTIADSIVEPITKGSISVQHIFLSPYIFLNPYLEFLS